MRWLYKASGSKLTYEGTQTLADEHGFLARSAHDSDGTWASNVRYVLPGDELHVYYAEDGRVREVGSYEIVERMDHPVPQLFGDRVASTALFNVVEPGFIRVVDTSGAYAPDSVLGKFTGWLLRRLGNPRAYDSGMFPGMHTLVRDGRASAARLFKEEDEAFETWCNNNPTAFYANLHGSEAPTESTYFLLHRAQCRVGAGRAAPETPQPRTGYNPKLAAPRIEDLLAWAEERRPRAVPVQRCGTCSPLDDLKGELEPTADPGLYDRRLRRLLQHDLPERPPGNATPEQKPIEGGLRYVRDPKVASWVLKRAAGRCELCLGEAPFHRKDGDPFLEVHHITWLANRGPDTPDNTAGVCPNCHRRLHHGADAEECAVRLKSKVSATEAASKRRRPSTPDAPS